MAETPTINWEGKSGGKYLYYIYPIGTTFKEEPGNYIFALQSRPQYWRPIYIGQTEDLSERFDNHHKMPCIKRNGASHIHVHLNSLQSTRLSEESDLLSNFSPICND
ncbi:hypothetical protein ES707_06772 [subsurface metagenome]